MRPSQGCQHYLPPDFPCVSAGALLWVHMSFVGILGSVLKECRLFTVGDFYFGKCHLIWLKPLNLVTHYSNFNISMATVKIGTLLIRVRISFLRLKWLCS